MAYRRLVLLALLTLAPAAACGNSSGSTSAARTSSPASSSASVLAEPETPFAATVPPVPTSTGGTDKPGTLCGSYGWPSVLPDDVGKDLMSVYIGDNLPSGQFEQGNLECFNVTAAYDENNHDVLTNTANDPSSYTIVRMEPAPGSSLQATDPVTLYVRPHAPGITP